MESKTVDEMSIKELRALIQAAGLRSDDCLEKSDLRTRAKQAQELQSTPKSSNPPTPPAKHVLHAETMKIAGYECRVVADAKHFPGPEQVKPDLVVIVLHGFGATNGDFVPLAEMVTQHPEFKERGALFVLPQAQILPETMGQSAWWKLDVMHWMQALQGGSALAELIRKVPPGLPECRERMLELVNHARVEVAGGVDPSRVILAGFSQGAMTAMDVSLALEKEHAVGGTIMMSGAPIVVEEWAHRLKNVHPGHKVFVSHGKADFVLPFVVSGWTHQLLLENGANVEYETHDGGHELGPQNVISKMLAFMKKVLQAANDKAEVS